MLELNSINCEYGKISYQINRFDNGPYNLWLYGFGLLPKYWFEEQAVEYGLDKSNWILPNYMGYGKSDNPHKEGAYSIKQSAKDILQIIDKEKIMEIIIFAHSIGGAVASHLITEICRFNEDSTFKIKIRLLNFIEGNLDKGDAFLTGEIAEMPFEKYVEMRRKRENSAQDISQNMLNAYFKRYHKEFQQIDNYALWTSAKDLYAESCKEIILSNLVKHSQNMLFPIIFFFGKNNKNKYSSEKLLEEHNQDIRYIENSGHFPHIEYPEGFWKKSAVLS